MARAAVTAAMWLLRSNRAEAGVLAHLPAVWRNARLPDERVVLTHGDEAHEVGYRAQRDGSFTVNGASTARIHDWSPDGIDVEVDGRRWAGRVTRSGNESVIRKKIIEYNRKAGSYRKGEFGTRSKESQKNPSPLYGAEEKDEPLPTTQRITSARTFCTCKEVTLTLRTSQRFSNGPRVRKAREQKTCSRKLGSSSRMR